MAETPTTIAATTTAAVTLDRVSDGAVPGDSSHPVPMARPSPAITTDFR